MEPTPYLVGGEWLSEGELVVIRSPFEQKEVGATFLAPPAQLQRAIAAAESSLPAMREMSSKERERILKTVSEGIAKDRESFARLVALEAGKPIKAARVEVDRAVLTFSLAAEESIRAAGEYLTLDVPGSDKRFAVVRRFPAGVVAAITPFNFPLNLVAHKVAPAIACGCPVVLKPAPQIPLVALKLAELIHKSELPAGALNVLPLRNENAGSLTEDDRIRVLSFTGSASVGWQLKAKAGKKRVLLELGGNAATIVHEDADVDVAAARCAFGGFTYAGQSCISVQRVLVQTKVFDRFVESLVTRVRALKCGDPLDESTDVGPLIRESDAVRVEQWIAEAVSGGAKLLCGGKRSGSFVEPAVLTGTLPSQRVNCEEIFGPVVTVEPYEEFSTALARANDSRYGLQAGVFTHNTALIAQAFEMLEVGGVIVNDVPTFRNDQMPYGGIKDSGMGREGIRYAMEEMTERKILVMG